MTAAPEAGELLLEVSPGTLQPLVVTRDDVCRLLDLQGELAAAGKQFRAAPRCSQAPTALPWPPPRA